MLTETILTFPSGLDWQAIRNSKSAKTIFFITEIHSEAIETFLPKDSSISEYLNQVKMKSLKLRNCILRRFTLYFFSLFSEEPDHSHVFPRDGIWQFVWFPARNL